MLNPLFPALTSSSPGVLSSHESSGPFSFFPAGFYAACLGPGAKRFVFAPSLRYVCSGTFIIFGRIGWARCAVRLFLLFALPQRALTGIFQAFQPRKTAPYRPSPS